MLQVGEFGGEELGNAAAADQGVPLGQAEQTEDLFGGGPFTGSLFRVKRKLLEAFSLHGQAQLTFDECLHQKCQEIG